MKKIFTILAAVIITASVFLPQQASAQAPERMSYQAVIRDVSNNLVPSHSIGMRISILQDSATGSAVYVETHTPTTNANGLVSIEIGGGIIISGVFAFIDWANGPYFIKTETDPTGGTNYTITGTSQLLSVPYALFAANSTPGPQGPIGNDGAPGPQGPVGNDGATGATGLQGPAGNNGVTGPQGPIGLTGAQGIQGLTGADGATGATGPTGADAGTTLYAVGTNYPALGGIVFQVNSATPNTLGSTGTHGLVAAPSDQSTSCTWYLAQNSISIYTTANSVAMVHRDWRLPTKNELNLMYVLKSIIGGFANSHYWSSTESDYTYAWFQYFDNGYQYYDYKPTTYYVRAVRAF